MVLRFINKAKEIAAEAKQENTRWAYLQAEGKLYDVLKLLEENCKMGIVSEKEKELVMKKLLEAYAEMLEKRNELSINQTTK